MDNPFSSIWSNISQKSRNPFLVTFFIVWLARNWEAVYAVFAFEEKRTIEEKITFIDGHLRYDSFWQILGELGINVAWAFGILVTTYILLNAARYITNIFENRITPRINQISDPLRIVSLEIYQEERKKVRDLEKRVEEERDEKLKVRLEIQNLEQRIQDLNKETTDSEEQFSIPQKNLHEGQGKQKKVNDWDSQEIPRQEFEKMVNYYSFDIVDQTISDIITNVPIDYKKHFEILDELIEKKLVILKTQGKKELNSYILTDKGNIFYNKYFTPEL